MGTKQQIEKIQFDTLVNEQVGAVRATFDSLWQQRDEDDADVTQSTVLDAALHEGMGFLTIDVDTAVLVLKCGAYPDHWKDDTGAYLNTGGDWQDVIQSIGFAALQEEVKQRVLGDFEEEEEEAEELGNGAPYGIEDDPEVLKSTIDSPEVRADVQLLAEDVAEGTTPDGYEIASHELAFEHGQWFIIFTDKYGDTCSASVVDAEPGRVHGLDVEWL